MAGTEAGQYILRLPDAEQPRERELRRISALKDGNSALKDGNSALKDGNSALKDGNSALKDGVSHELLRAGQSTSPP